MGSIYNTPPVFAIYVSLLVTRWLREEVGGLEAMAALNREKAARLYALLDTSDRFYTGRAAPADRSWMNVVFNLPSPELEETFLREAEETGFYGLRGHRTLGGLRASLYNAVSLEAVAALCDFMESFRERHRHHAR
jgi:phosphoserine aminotransferase